MFVNRKSEGGCSILRDIGAAAGQQEKDQNVNSNTIIKIALLTAN